MVRITHLTPGQQILCGDHMVEVSSELASRFADGDRLIALQVTGELLHVAAQDISIVEMAVAQAAQAFHDMASITDVAISDFFVHFANNLSDPIIFAEILQANERDVTRAQELGRSTSRLILSEKMQVDMVTGLQMWASLEMKRETLLSTVNHEGWIVESWSAPLGVVGFVFEGRPNVFADATGVLRTGNTVVFRIGSDARSTARAIQEMALRPALRESGLPMGAVSLIDSPSHGAGWALFGDTRLALGVARGSGVAVAQLGAVARQAGIPVSLHGTGGAWMLLGSSVNKDRLGDVIFHSLDRKVCNTLNVLCLPRSLVEVLSRDIFDAFGLSGKRAGSKTVVHIESKDAQLFSKFKQNAFIDLQSDLSLDLAHEWEWETSPELSLVVVESLSDGVDLFNSHSPQFVVSCISDEVSEIEYVWKCCNAPFFGDGYTRWVDGQYALNRPELGLANWQGGRLLARPGILSGDGIHTVRLRVHQSNSATHR